MTIYGLIARETANLLTLKTQMKNTFKQRLLIGSITLTLAAPSAFGVTETFDTVTAPGFTWTCPAGVTSIQVECWGGGGAGGQGTKTTTAGTNTSQNGGGAAAGRMPETPPCR